jgi:hypothetical protein
MQTKIASSWLRGCRFNNYFAFALPVFLFLPGWATISFNSGLNIAKRRTSRLYALCYLFMTQSSGERRYAALLKSQELFVVRGG